VKKITLTVMAIMIAVVALQAKPSITSLEEKLARNPKDAKALYELTRIYCEQDSVPQAVESWEKLAELDKKLAADVFLVTKVASYNGIEPFFPQLLTDTMAEFVKISSDGKRIVVQKVTNGRTNVAIMDLNGENYHWITTAGMNDNVEFLSPAFAGSNSSILYLKKMMDGSGMELLYHDLNGGDSEVVFSNVAKYIDFPSWGGNYIAFNYFSPDTKSLEIGLYNRNKGELIELTNNIYAENYPEFSSDGKEIVYVKNPALQEDIYIMNTKGKDIEQVTNWPGSDALPTFGDHNKKIAFISDRNGGGQYDIFIYDRKTKDIFPVTVNPARDITPALSEDGNWLIFESERGDGAKRLYILSLNQPITVDKLLEKMAKIKEERLEEKPE